jgi:hypothetical protein
MNRRRAIILGAVGFPLVVHAALGKGTVNSGLLLARIGLDRSTIPFDGEFSVTCSLGARLKFCRVYLPLRWAEKSGFQLDVIGPDNKVSGPQRYPLSVLPEAASFGSLSHYHELDVGEQVSFHTKMKTKDVFPSSGSYKLRAIYLPEPPAKLAVGQAIVAENGPVETGLVRARVA